MGNLDNVQFVDQAQLKQVMLANADKADKRYVKKSELNVDTFVKQDEIGALAGKDTVGTEDLDPVLAAAIEGKADADDVYTKQEAQQAIADAIGGLGNLASLDKVSADDLTDAVKNRIEDTYTKAEVYTKEEVYDKAEVDSAIRNQVASVYKPAGSATVETLPEATESTLGFVYNISEDGYTTEDFVEGEGQKIAAGTNVVVIAAVEDEETVYKYDVFAGEMDLSEYVKKEDIQVATSVQIQDIIDSIFRGEDLNPSEEIVDIVLKSNTSLAEIGRAFDDPEVTTVNAKLAEDITVPVRADGKISTTMISEGQTVNLDLNGKTIDCDAYCMYLQPGSVLNLTGEGTITTHNLNTYGAFQNNGGTISVGPNVTIDTTQAEVPEGGHNWLYGIVNSKDGLVKVDGEIITDEASCLAITNGTSEGVGAQFIVEGDAHLKTLKSGAVYLADNKTVLVKDNALIEGGCVLRMGDLIVQDNAQIKNELTFQDDRGVFYVSSGVAAVREAVMLMAGCYKAGGEGQTNDMHLVVKDNAKISSTNGEAVTVNRLDTLYDQVVTVDIEDSSNLTAADGFDKVKVFEYDEIADIVTASGKTMPARKVESDVTITVDGSVVYPA